MDTYIDHGLRNPAADWTILSTVEIGESLSRSFLQITAVRIGRGRGR